MALVERALHVVATLLTITVLVGFGLFALDQARDLSRPGQTHERHHTWVRRAIDDVNEVLLKPFRNVTTDPDPWIARGVPTLLAVLAYGFGLGFAASLARGRFR